MREVDSSSDPMFPDAGQELVLHTLEQIPEDERFQFITSFISAFHLNFFWSQDLKGRCKEEARQTAKVSDLGDWGGR